MANKAGTIRDEIAALWQAEFEGEVNDSNPISKDLDLARAKVAKYGTNIIDHWEYRHRNLLKLVPRSQRFYYSSDYSEREEKEDAVY